MNLTYVLGPVVAADTVLNVNVQFHRVYDKQENEYGWGWHIEGDNVTEEQDGLLEVDPHASVEQLLNDLREAIYDALGESYPDAVL